MASTVARAYTGAGRNPSCKYNFCEFYINSRAQEHNTVNCHGEHYVFVNLETFAAADSAREKKLSLRVGYDFTDSGPTM